MIRWLIAAIIPLAACAQPVQPIDPNNRVEGWPKLRVVEHYIPRRHMENVCGGYSPRGLLPTACAVFLFSVKECHIYYSTDPLPEAWIYEHEWMHCLGYEHVGSNSMARALRDYKGGK